MKQEKKTYVKQPPYLAEHKRLAREDAKHVILNSLLQTPTRWYEDFEVNREYEKYFHMWINYYLKEGLE